MEELIKYIINHITEEPEKIQITVVENTITVAVPKKDIGKIIGKQGRIAKAIRTIIKAASKEEGRINLDITEAE